MGRIGGNQPNPNRSSGDFYPTAPGHTRVVFPWLPKGKVWECAAGDGSMSDVLAERGGVHSSDLTPRRADVVRADFLQSPLPKGCRSVVTNPPFSLALEFIEHGLELGVPCAFLLPVNYLGSAKRLRLFTERPPSDVVVVSNRMQLPGGASQFNHAWFVWSGSVESTRLSWVLA